MCVKGSGVSVRVSKNIRTAIAASFSRQGMRHDWLAAFMMSSILLNPQLIFYSAALGPTALWVRIISCCICGAVAGWLVGCFFPQQPEWVGSLFGENEGFGVLLAATIGVPLYACGGGTIPLREGYDHRFRSFNQDGGALR